MNCTAAPRLEADAPDSESSYALEGTLAHAFCARKLKKHLGLSTAAEDAEIAELSPRFYSGEMDEYTDAYATAVIERLQAARTMTPDARLLVETRLDFSEYVPESFGTSDATIIADGLMEVIDFKYGKGVRVEAVHNEQMMIYALGAFLRHSLEYGIRRVRMTIVQPRIDNLSEYEISVADLLRWADEELRPKAREAFDGTGAQRPGEWCRFCRVKGACKALAGKCVDTARAMSDPALLTPEDMARDVLPWLSTVKSWVASIEEYTLQQALSGVAYSGYKVVEGRSVRRISDENAVADILHDQGYDDSEFMKPSQLCGITELERLVGKKRFTQLCGDYVTKPQGKPTLVEAGDKRPAYNTAADDFGGVEV